MNRIKIYSIAFALGITFGLLMKFSPIGEAYVVDIKQVDTLEQTLLCSLEATHVHAYTNESGPTDGIEYWARTNKFRIYLHDDFIDNVNLDSLECSSGSRWISCDGGTSTSDGGTSVKFVRNNTSSDAIYPDYVEWTYGTTTASDSPIIPGYNDYDEDGTIDSSPESDRTMGEYLTYDFIEDGSGKASTTSSVYIKFWAYNIAKGTWTAVPEDGETDYHWNNDTGTNITNYTCPAAGCALMTITPDEVGVNNLYTNTSFEVTAYDKSGNDITSDLSDGYSYSATGEGYFKFNPFQLTKSQSKTTTDTTFAYQDAGAGDSFTVKAVGYEDTCSVAIEFPYCKDLSIDRPTSGPVAGDSYQTNIKVSVDASNGEDWPFDLTYSSTDSSATFDGNKTPYTSTDTTVDYESSKSAGVNVQADHDTLGYCADNFSYTLTKQPASPVCSDLSIGNPDSNNCWAYQVSTDTGFEGTLVAQGNGTENITITDKSGATNTGTNPRVALRGGKGEYTGTVCWPDYSAGETLNVYMEGASACYDSYTSEAPSGGGSSGGGSSGGSTPPITPITPVTPVTPEVSGAVGTLNKYIYTFNFSAEKNSYTDNNIFFSHDDDAAFYTLEYDPEGGEKTITFNDTMWTSNLKGYLGDGTESGGYINLASRSEINSYGYKLITRLGLTDQYEVGSENIGEEANSYGKYWQAYIKYLDSDKNPSLPIHACSENSTETCYDPNYEPTKGNVVIKNAANIPDDAVIRVRYVGIVNATDGLCDNTNDSCLTETFNNTGSVETGQATLMENAKLVVLCSYLVTRNAGDVYLEQSLPNGTDLACIYNEAEGETESQYANVEGVIIQAPEAASTSSDPEETGGFCTSAEQSSGFIGNLSSYVCEIVSAVSDLWKPDTITSTTESRVSEETRNAETLQYAYDFSGNLGWDTVYAALVNKNNPDSGILYFEGDANNTQLKLGRIKVPSGAWTIIVQNADLVLNGDVTYEDTNVTQEIPSVAFVVLGGNINVGRGAHSLSGVYYTDQGFTGAERSAVDDPLTFYGSIYGDVSELLKAANYVGPPTLDGGGIVVRYDSRILLNTPPGLGEYIDVNTQQAVN